MDFERLKARFQTQTPSPLHVRLREGIQEQIEDNTLPPGSKLPSERELQEMLGVSRATVRQALRFLIDNDLLQSTPGTGTFVLESAVVEKRLVGLIVSGPNFHFFYPQLAAAFSTCLRQSGYVTSLVMHNEQVEHLIEAIQELMAQNVAALAITPPRHGDRSLLDSWLAELTVANVPVVFIGRQTARYPHIDCIATDNWRIGYEATRHLLELGHRRIVHIGILDYSTGRSRAEGYRQAMIEAGLEPSILQISDEVPDPALPGSSPSEHLATPAYQIALELWSTDRPTAVFCFNDVSAMGVYKALRDLALRIPEDVSLISVDNLLTTRHFEVPLTTFALPGEAIGCRGAEVLLRRIAGKVDTPELQLLAAPIIIRASTAPASPS